MSISIRPYNQNDLQFVYDICLKTGDSGNDASGIYTDPKLLGHFYAAPYVIMHTELSFIVDDGYKPIGYIIGTDNSENFFNETEKKWFPDLRIKYPLPDEKDTSPDARIIRLIHKGHKPRPELLDYPAHLHIDILPEGQGLGLGKKLIHMFCDKLRDINVQKVHLEVGKKNLNAIKFYEKVGFKILVEFEWSIAFGMDLYS